MTCPSSCVRQKGHPGFHTTHPEIAKREDAPSHTLYILPEKALAEFMDPRSDLKSIAEAYGKQMVRIVNIKD